jgi:hypothetical protein
MENYRVPKTIMEWETEGRPLGTWIDGIKYSMEKYGLRVEDTTHRKEWRRKIFQYKFLFVLFNGLTLHALLLLYLLEENLSSDEIPKEEEEESIICKLRSLFVPLCFSV